MTDNCHRLEARVHTPLLHGSNLVTFAVTDKIILAGQPEPEDWVRLAQQGFSLVVNVRSDPQRAAAQADKAHAEGLAYQHLTVPAYELETAHIQAFRDALAAAAEGKVLVHCRTASRVALMWMLHRMVNDGWNQQQAEAELQQAGYSDDDMDVFRYCTEDFLERASMTDLILS